MEYRYGSRESFERALIQAVNESKGKMIFLSLASSMEQAKDFAGAESLFEKALKRPQFRKSKKVWMAYHALKLHQQDVAGAKAQLSRALQALAPHKHVEVIRHFAMMEFDTGAVDRGRVLMEELLSSYPKRNDLWTVYVDKEVKLGNVVLADDRSESESEGDEDGVQEVFALREQVRRRAESGVGEAEGP